MDELGHRGVGNPHRCRSSRRKRIEVEQHAPVFYAQRVGRQLFRERRRSASILRTILIAMPGTGDAAVDDSPFAEWPALMRADATYRGELVAESEDGDTLCVWRRNDLRTSIFNRV